MGVFQDEDPDLIAYTVKQLGLSSVQLHGEESPKYIKELRRSLPKTCEIWKAHGIFDSLPSFEKFSVDKHVLDTRIGKQSGGTGQAFDWSLLQDDKINNSTIEKAHVILAGGLSPENAQQAAKVGCAGLDFNSGLESAPGIKDTRKINTAFSEVRKYQQRD